MTTDALGTVNPHEGGYLVRFERHLTHPREKVWRAITESEHLVEWMPCDMVGERRAGAAISLPFRADVVERHQIETPILPGRIDVWDPPAVFEWWWDTDRLRFELDEVDGGTRLRFSTWLSPEGDAPAYSAAAGYHVCLAHLAQLLDTGSAPPLIDADTATLEDQYREVVPVT
jgi:uncharacterized protein YndB with AHSA1/START domain